MFFRESGGRFFCSWNLVEGSGELEEGFKIAFVGVVGMAIGLRRVGSRRGTREEFRVGERVFT